MAKAKQSASVGKTSKKSSAAKQAPEVATAADAVYAAKLGHSATHHVEGPTTALADVFASEEAQLLLVAHAGAIASQTGIDPRPIAAAAVECAEAAAQVMRFVESTNRCFEAYEELRDRAFPAESELRSELRKLGPKAPLRGVLANIINSIVAASGTDKAQRTRRANKKKPA